MTTLTEIEAAAATLSRKEVAQLEDFLKTLHPKDAKQMPLEELYRRTGFYPLPRRSDEVVTEELVRQIREEEGI